MPNDKYCPKCHTEKSGESCPKCGLIFAKYSSDAIDAKVPQGIKDLWESTEANWDDSSSHAVFIEHALIAGEGGFAASCYRRKGDDPTALEQLGKINKRLEQILLATATEPTKKTGNKPLMALTLFLFALVAGGLFYYAFFRGQ